MKEPKQPRARWKQWFAALCIIAAVVVVIDYFFLDTLAVGSTMRFLYNVAIFAVLWFLRAGEALIVLLSRRRAIRLTRFVTGIGLGYASRVVLSDSQAKKTFTWQYWLRQNIREKLRIAVTLLRGRWLKLPLWGKSAFVVALIAAQVVWVPLAKWIVLFPVGFMVPFLLVAWKYVIGVIADSFIGKMYWRYLGWAHRKAIEKAENVPVAREVKGAVLLTRLQYLTAWRMWKHDPCYRTVKGRRRVSIAEPMRLWWRRELNGYVGKPLLSGNRYSRQPSTYVPPPLWYERDRPISRAIMMVIALVAVAVATRGSVRR